MGDALLHKNSLSLLFFAVSTFHSHSFSFSLYSLLCFVLFSYDEVRKSWYYFNFGTGETQWEHPLDQHFKSIVEQAREGNQN